AGVSAGAGGVGAICLVFAGAPPQGRELLAHVAARLGLELGAASRQRRFARAVSELGDERLRDDLGIYSRAFVREIVAIELARAVRQGRPLAVAIVDIVGMH